MRSLRYESPSQDRFAASAELRLRHLDDEAVVFDPLSWDAHLLNAAALAVLELLLEAPRSENEVVSFLVQALQPDERSQASAHAHRVIGELDSLGLIDSVEAA